MQEEKLIIYSSNSLQCGYIKYPLTPEMSFNIIQFHYANYLDSRWSPYLPPAKHPVLKIDPTKLPDEWQIHAESIGVSWFE